ncbi:hypothetical protein BH11PSE3_BH11PSE3_01060 [soil metagenome]
MRLDWGGRAISPYYLLAAMAFCTIVGLYDIVYVVALNLADQRFALMLKPVVNGPTIYPDFITPYAATQAYFKGLQSVVYDPVKFTAFLNELYAYRFDFKFQPFLYPPVWALVLLPLGLIPVYLACLLFMVSTAAASAFEMRRSLWSWLAVATSPAAVWVVLSGQNTFLYIALIYGGLRLVEKSPVAAGVLLGCLVYKPQICLLVPLALLASRQWKALAWMIATGTIIVLVSVAVFGFDFWLDYLNMTLRLSEPGMVDFWASRRSTFQISPFVAARILLLPDTVAKLLQLATALLGAAAVWFAFRRFPASAARTAVLMAATLLVSPYSINYDMMLLLPAALLLYRQGAATGFYPLEPLLYVVLWLMPTAILWFNYRAPLTPVVVLAFGLFALLRLRASGPVTRA